LRYLSVCSGIEAASVAWSPLGWTPVGFSEIEQFPCKVLAERYGSNLPGEPLSHNAPPNFGDMTKFKDWPDAVFNILVGGTPCQSFSVAGLRTGLADPRGNLCLTYLAILDRYRPDWCVWENVPGVLSSNGGRDFGAFLGELGQLGYGFAYRVLDAQFVRVDGFGRAVPQRRRRVFVIGYSGDWRRAAAVLFDAASLRGGSAPRRKSGQSSAPTLSARTKGGGGLGTDSDLNGGLIVHALRAEGFDASEDGTGRGTPIILIAFDTTHITSKENGSNPKPGDPCHTLTKDSHAPLIAYRTSPNCGAWETGDRVDALTTGTDPTSHLLVERHTQWTVRRFTPLEWERLQGFPDGYTAITIKGKSAADGPRYKALGNSMAVNCMRWIGRRIEIVESMPTR